MPSSRRAAVVTILTALAAIFLLDAAIFRTKLYFPWIQPESSTGLVEYRLQAEIDRQRGPDKLVISFGDSRFAYLPRVANQYTPESGYVFRHGGTAGSSARDWYYMLRDLDPTCRRYQAVVIGFDDLEDENSQVRRQDDPRSLHYVIGRLRLTDTWDFARSHLTPPLQWTAWRGGILKGIAMQSDFHEFLLNPRQRIRTVRMFRKGWAGWAYDYDDEERSLAGVTIDWKTRQITLPPNVNPGYRDMFNQTLLRPPPPDNDWRAAFQREWIGRIADRYRDSQTRLVFIRLPRGPIAPLADVPLNPESTMRKLARRPRVLLGNPLRYQELERPEYFKDPLHLNRAGAHAFSKLLVDEIRHLIGPPH